MNVGIDILEISRFANLENDKIKLKKIFTKHEIEYFNKFSNKLIHMAGIFCAKEAFVKALKVGFNKGITPTDIEILHNENGSPYIHITEKLKAFIGNKDVDISISHSNTDATAICIIM